MSRFERWLCVVALTACVWHQLDGWYLFVQVMGLIIGGSLFFAWLMHLQLGRGK